MRRKRRFKIPEAALKKYKAAPGVAGNPLYEYDQFRRGLKSQTFKGQTRGPNQERDMIPFGVGSQDLHIIVPVSNRSIEAGSLTATGMTEALLGLSPRVEATEYAGFDIIPAKAVIFVGSGVASEGKTTSQITKIPYNKTNGTSYTYPFGNVAGNTEGAFGRMGALTIASAAIAKSRITFSAERMYGQGI